VKTPRTAVRVEQVTDEQFRSEIDPQLETLERRYGLPSARLEEAFRVDGELIEHDDFLLWQRLYETWRNVGGPAR
jgi:hypothetical protein